MARDKKEEDQPDTGGWINTFADLMNLLLCFFVLLFSMSTVDADKYQQLVTSMTEKIGIFSNGGATIGEGPFVSSGTDQAVSISQYFNEFENTGEDDKSKEDQKTTYDGEQNKDTTKEDKKDATESEEQTAAVTAEVENAVEEKKFLQQKEKTEAVYSDVVDAAEAKNVDDDISINVDKDYQYVQISLNGGILFDSGTAEIKKSMFPVLSKVGDILKKYGSHHIKIEGHTDNVPISSGQFKNNTYLSSARATEVFEYLVKKKKMNPANLEPTGCGEYHPIADNKTSKGRARNRRVEIKIYTSN